MLDACNSSVAIDLANTLMSVKGEDALETVRDTVRGVLERDCTRPCARRAGVAAYRSRNSPR